MAEQRSRNKSRRLLPSPTAAATPTGTPPAASSLPEDLVLEILSRLPVNSLCRFRCVSKGWDLLVSDPAFAAAHRSRHAEPFLVVSSRSDYGNDDSRYDVRLMDMDGNVVRAVTEGVAGGDVELVSTAMDDLICVADGSCGGARVIDPATGEVLADCPNLESQYPGGRTIFGFGRAVPSGAYKVVRLVNNGRPCEVFALGDGAGWRTSRSGPTYQYTSQASPVTINGVMYFLRCRLLESDRLLCFDLETEEVKSTVEGPPKGPDPWRNAVVDIFELNNALCMIRVETGANNCYERANVWLITSSEENPWVNAYTISMPQSAYGFTPLRVTPDGGKLVFFYYSIRGDGGLLQVYDSRVETCTTLCRLDYGVYEVRLCGLHLDRFVPRQKLAPMQFI